MRRSDVRQRLVVWGGQLRVRRKRKSFTMFDVEISGNESLDRDMMDKDESDAVLSGLDTGLVVYAFTGFG